MKNKKVVGLLIFLFILLVIALPSVCTFIPYRDAYFSEDTDMYYEIDDEGDINYYLAGNIINPSICEINEIKFEICYYNAVGEFVCSQEVKEEINLAGGQEYAFVTVVLASPDGWEYWAIEGAECRYTTLKPWWYYTIGIALFGISMLFFAKKKFYFDIDSHKIEVYADARKATLVIDGKLYKKLSVKTRSENANCKFKIKNKILSVTLKMGQYWPDVEITVDGVIPKFKKIKQHSFLKSSPKKNNNSSK